jgi:hypothetical protein
MSAQSAAPDPLPGRPRLPFECTLTTAGARAAWVRVAGELDLSTSPRLERALREAQLDFRAVVLDTREVSFIDCRAVHVILAVAAGADWGVPPLKFLAGQVVEDLLRLLGVHGQIRSFDLVPSELVPGDVELVGQPHADFPMPELERSLVPSDDRSRQRRGDGDASSRALPPA